MFYIDMLVRLLIKLGLLKGTNSIKLGKAERSISGQFGAASVPSFRQAYLVALISVSLSAYYLLETLIVNPIPLDHEVPWCDASLELDSCTDCVTSSYLCSHKDTW
jgi:hypothetical protein